MAESGDQRQQEQQGIHNAIFKVAAGVSAKTGLEFFPHLTQYMVEALGATGGFIAKFLPGGPLRCRTVVAIIDGELVDNFDYLVEDTPCRNLLKNSYCVVAADVAAQYPQSHSLANLGAQSYVGWRMDNTDGQPLGLIFVLFRDALEDTEFVTSTLKIFAERTGSEFERQEAEARLRHQASLLDKAQDAIFVQDLNHLVSYWNQSATRLYGWTREEACGKSIATLLYDSESEFLKVTHDVLAMGEWSGEIQQRRKDGTPVWVEARWTLIRDELGQPETMFAINTDITGRKRAQEEILRLNADLEVRVQQRTAELQAANTELEAFSYSVSHDLRSPLSTIGGFSQLLVQLEGEKISDKGKHYLNRICTGIQQMGELIEGLLSLAKLSRDPMRFEPVDLAAVARRVEQECRDREPERQVQTHIQEDLLAHGDPLLLSVVMHNLLGNAWKFTSRQATARIAIGSQGAAGGNAIYFVKDNGAGFDMTFAEKLFGTFERLHSPSDFAGTGVGLAIVKRVIDRHGGRVWAESRVNEGATFYFTLERKVESGDGDGRGDSNGG